MILALSGLLALFYLVQVRLSPSLLRSFWKTGSIAILALAAIPHAPLLALALGLCAAGDLALSREGERAFLLGIAAFALGHLVYIALFLTAPLSQGAYLLRPGAVLVALVLGCLAVGLARSLWDRAGALRLPVIGYIAIIMAMVLAALTLPPGPGVGWVRLGVGLFVLSDIVLSLETFVLGRGDPARRITAPVIWTTYWAAQAALWTGLLAML